MNKPPRFITRDLFDQINREHIISEIYHGYQCSCGFVCTDHYAVDKHKHEMFQKVAPDWLCDE